MLAATLAAAAMLTTAPAALNADDSRAIHALLITGVNNHNWKFTSRVHKDTLEATGRFHVDIVEKPDEFFKDPSGLNRYQVFIVDYNNQGQNVEWGDAAKKHFADAVRAGAGVVAIHAANNSWKGWADWEKMVGLVWREGAGHGKVHRFDVDIVDADHPVTSGLPVFKDHLDELYHGLSNPQQVRPRLLMQAMSSAESGGTGKFEPMSWTLQFDGGRVFTTALGHVWVGDQASKRSVLDPQFRALIARAAEWAATGNVSLPARWQDVRTHNTLTADEAAAGWQLLFDGTSPVGLRGYKSPEFPGKGWSVKEGCLVHAAQGGGGDIITRDQYGDFEFACEWKVARGGNSGIMYRCDQAHNYPWETGREMQILDDEHHADGKKPKTRAGTMYDLFACDADVARPHGEWNRARVVCRGTVIEHWLNGVRVVAVDTSGDEYRKAYAASKFPSMPDFGKPMSGHIALQDHGDEVWFRNIKVRRLDADR